MKPREIKSNVERIIHTCTITAKSNEVPNLTLRLSDLPEDKAKKIYKILKNAFREIEVVSEITGEVLISHYISDDWFVPLYPYNSVMEAIITICEGE